MPGACIPLDPDGAVRHKLAARGPDRSAGDAGQAQAALAQFVDRLSAASVSGLVCDYDGTITAAGSGHALPAEPVQHELIRLLGDGLALGLASGRGRSLHRELRLWVPPSLWPQVLVGMHNGGAQLRLAEPLGDSLPHPRLTDEAAAEIAALADRLDVLRRSIDGFVLDVRPAQLAVKALVPTPQRLADLAVLVAAEAAALPARQLRWAVSSYAVDVLPRVVDKHLVTQAMPDPDRTLCIGDAGQPGGNDFELLDKVTTSVTVDRGSARLDRCWNLAPELRGPDGLVGLLAGLRAVGSPGPAGFGFAC